MLAILLFFISSVHFCASQDLLDQRLMNAVARNQVDIAKVLVKIGAQVNTSHMRNHPSTPLSFAALHGNTEMVKLLLRAGADANKSDDQGWHPLGYATTGCHKTWNYEIIKELVAAGAIAYTRDRKPCSFLDALRERFFMYLRSAPNPRPKAIQRVAALIKTLEYLEHDLHSIKIARKKLWKYAIFTTINTFHYDSTEIAHIQSFFNTDVQATCDEILRLKTTYPVAWKQFVPEAQQLSLSHTMTTLIDNNKMPIGNL